MGEGAAGQLVDGARRGHSELLQDEKLGAPYTELSLRLPRGQAQHPDDAADGIEGPRDLLVHAWILAHSLPRNYVGSHIYWRERARPVKPRQRRTGMTDMRALGVPLKGFGSPATEAAVVVELVAPRRRFGRAAAALGIGVAAALVALPIPIVHFFFVPAALLVGVVLGAVRLRQREIFRSAEGSCPLCGTRQMFGLAGRAFRLPRQVHCAHCGQALDLGEAPR
jgi:hypothetical protein